MVLKNTIIISNNDKINTKNINRYFNFVHKIIGLYINTFIYKGISIILPCGWYC